MTIWLLWYFYEKTQICPVNFQLGVGCNFIAVRPSVHPIVRPQDIFSKTKQALIGMIRNLVGSCCIIRYIVFTNLRDEVQSLPGYGCGDIFVPLINFCLFNIFSFSKNSNKKQKHLLHKILLILTIDCWTQVNSF